MHAGAHEDKPGRLSSMYVDAHHRHVSQAMVPELRDGSSSRGGPPLTGRASRPVDANGKHVEAGHGAPTSSAAGARGPAWSVTTLCQVRPPTR